MNSRVVLVTAVRSALGVSGEHDGLTVADVRHPDAVETLLGDVHRQGELALITCAQEDYETVRRLVSFAQVRYPGLRACIEPLPGTPMAVGVISSLVDDIHSDDDTLAWRLGALDLLRTHVWSAVWLRKVTTLTDPSPKVVQHVRSWLPGSAFLAVASPDPAVMNATKAPLTGLEPRPGSALFHSTLDGRPWIVPAVAEALQTQSVTDVLTVREQIDAYGSADAVEFVAVPLSFHSDSRPDPSAVVSCTACGSRHARAACPSCGMVAGELAAASQGETS